MWKASVVVFCIQLLGNWVTLAQEYDKGNEQPIYYVSKALKDVDKVSQDRKSMLSGHLCLSKIEMLFLSPSDPLDNKISSYKSFPSPAFFYWKSGPVVGVAFLI